MKKVKSGTWYKKVKANLPVIIVGCLYFGMLVFTICQKLRQDKITGSLIELSIVVTAFGAGSYIMFFYTKNKLKNRHVTRNTEMEFEITKKRVLLDKLTAVLFLLVGVILMVLTLL